MTRLVLDSEGAQAAPPSFSRLSRPAIPRIARELASLAAFLGSALGPIGLPGRGDQASRAGRSAFE